MNRYHLLDQMKAALAAEVWRRFTLAQIRQKSIENLQRWRDQGTWGQAYEDWWAIVTINDEGPLRHAMLGQDERANQLRQSPPYVGLLPQDVVAQIRAAHTPKFSIQAG